MTSTSALAPSRNKSRPVVPMRSEPPGSASRFVALTEKQERGFRLEQRSIRTRSMLILLEPDRLHCWALIVALVSSVTGLALLVSSGLN